MLLKIEKRIRLQIKNEQNDKTYLNPKNFLFLNKNTSFSSQA